VHNVLDRAYPLRGQVGGWALEIEGFMGPVKWHRAERRVPFGAQKTRTVQTSTGSCCPDTFRCISGPCSVDMYRRAHLVSDFIEASRNFFSLKRQPKIFENYQRSFKKYCFAFKTLQTNYSSLVHFCSYEDIRRRVFYLLQLEQVEQPIQPVPAAPLQPADPHAAPQPLDM
jgi:hypothetical protein